ncbi:diphosphomevalonate decarboxylase [Candidatus Gottesmanbacteria bacterium]|nr:diphosphomevalonate decarboxylase [Candidatus Gottesmanbacteria bacterium]
MKATAIAPANVGLIKYWGRIDESLRIPENGSISVNLSSLTTTTTVEFHDSYEKDQVTIVEIEDVHAVGRVLEQIDRIRKRANIKAKARVVSHNSFPTSTGLSSSSSGFAALTLAASSAAGLELSEKELSILARLGSGSACRSIPDGFVEWTAGSSHESSYAYSVFPPDHWDIVDIVVVVSTTKKEVSSTQGQKYARTSVFYPTRLSHIGQKIREMKSYIEQKDFFAFGKTLEEEALELHAVMLTSKPPLLYFTSETITLLKRVLIWRSEGLPVFFTLNTGQDIHLFCEKKNQETLLANLKSEKEVQRIIVNNPAKGARLTNNHLF